MSEGNITAHIQPIEGKVIITFPTQVTYLSMPPDQAEAFANIVLGAARAARAERPVEDYGDPGGPGYHDCFVKGPCDPSCVVEDEN